MFFFLIISVFSIGAKDLFPTNEERAAEIQKMMWEEASSDFRVTEIPEKWTGKSAVIIAKSHSLSYRKPALSGVLHYDFYSHYRVKILDQSAVEEYSQFSFPGSSRDGRSRYDVYQGFKIIKPSGEEIEISTENAVKQERELNNEGFDIYKLAIPNLEIGDIIDYYISQEQELVQNVKYHIFDPKLFQLNDDYPIMKQKITFDVMRRCYINLNTLNGAPDFKVVSKEDDDSKKYVLVDEDRESAKDIRWFFPNRQLASIKLQVIYASATMANELPFFLGKPEELKSKVSKREVDNLFKRFYGQMYYVPKEVIKYTKKNLAKEKDLNIKAREIYYAFRYYSEIQYEEGATIKGTSSYSRNNLKDIIALSKFYKSQKIPHEIIVSVPRDISALDDLILLNEMSYVLKVNTSRPFYISNISNFSTPTTIPEDLQGVEAYSYDMNENLYYLESEKITMPKMTFDENHTRSDSEIFLEDLNEDKTRIITQKSIKGLGKHFYQKYVMDYYDYIDEEKNRFDVGESFINLGRKDKEKMLIVKEEYLEKRDDEFNDVLKTIVDNDLDFTVENANSRKIVQTGRYDDAPEFVYSFESELSGVIKRVGKNYLVSIGKFIEGQVDLTEEERKRDYDIYQPYARSYNYNVTLNIPDGYVVDGIDKLNKNVENETGGFVSEATVSGNQLKISTTKYYSDNYFPKEKWTDMTKFLDAAYDFTQVEILLKKK
ncbi:DUF3857 domain-containing protein [Marinigracilibium pacificum]|uniref:DUF3857 domain-containing protein n=1 Tax=Marinigracilibium pacificum TaxID=2729599 RepID=A0A848J8F3_9BACT|nr:DUF3857 domain-containing protein [Marinigracilibium pacificum]NMM50704.1 DUF3857 domain-containing protein [Marinigracilibium pacificum]